MHALLELLPVNENGMWAGQCVHVAAPLTGENVPRGQGVQMPTPAALKVPAPQRIWKTPLTKRGICKYRTVMHSPFCALHHTQSCAPITYVPWSAQGTRVLPGTQRSQQQ